MIFSGPGSERLLTSQAPPAYSPIKQKLLERGYVYQKIELDGEMYHQYTAPNGAKWIYSWHFRNYPFISISARKISINKRESYAFARLHGVQTPDTIQANDGEVAKAFLAKHTHVVVKPSDMGGGVGVTVDVTTPDQLSTAIKAATFNAQLPIIQKQFFGEEIRLTVLKGTVKSVILRRTPRIVGDGLSSVAELILAENKEREALHFNLLSYPLLDEKLLPADVLQDTRILEKNEVYELSKTTMIKYGASFYGIAKNVHPSYVEIAEELAQSLNPAMLVVDMMVSDFTAPARDENYTFLEFNTAPAPAIYSSLRGGDSPDIVDEIINMIDEYCQTFA